MHVESDAPVQPQKTLKTLTRERTTHRLIRRKRVQMSVQPTITKNPARAELGFSSPRSLKNLTIGRSNQVQKELKFWADEDDDFKNTSPKDFNESPYGLRGIEENRSKSGVFSRTQKCRFERARESKEICTKQ